MILANSYKGRKVNRDEKVSVHRNLNADTLTIKVGELVHGHAQMVGMKDVTFHVGTMGNIRVRTSKQKNVHAYVKGTLAVAHDIDSAEKNYEILETLGYKRVYYNPYKVDTFVYFDTFEPIHKADEVFVVMDRVYVR